MIQIINEKIFSDTNNHVGIVVSVRDLNDFEWRFVTTKEGIMLGYFGDEYFKETYFDFDLGEEENLVLKNSGFFLFTKTQEAMTLQGWLINMLKIITDNISINFTDGAWDYIKDVLNHRLQKDDKIYPNEIVC